MMMHKTSRWTRMLCLLLALLLMGTTLTACDQSTPVDTDTTQGDTTTNSNNNNNTQQNNTQSGSSGYQTLAQRTGYGYRATYSTLEMDLEYAYNLQRAGDRLMMYGQIDDEQTGYQTVYLTMNPDGSDIQQVKMPTLGENESVQNYCATDSGAWMVTYEWVYSGDGGIAYATSDAVAETAAVAVIGGATSSTTVVTTTTDTADTASDDWSSSTATDDDWTSSTDSGDDWTGSTDSGDDTTEEPTEPSTDEPATETPDDDIWIDIDDGETEEPEAYENYEVYRLYQLDSEGNILQQPDLTPMIEQLEYFYVNNLFVDQQGRVYMTCDNTLFQLDQNGQQTGMLQVENWINSCSVLPSGEIIVSYYGEMGVEVRPLDPETMELGEAYDLGEDYSYDFLTGGGSYDLYINDRDVLSGLNLETGEITEILSWLDSDVDIYSMNGFCILDDETIVFLYQSDGGSVELGTLTRVPVDELPVRETITLAGRYLNYDMRRLISSFNRRNEEFRITFVDYSSYDTEASPTGAYDRIDMEMASGQGPDILMDNLISDQSNYVAKGMLVDLYTLMGDSSEWQKEDLVEGYRRATEIDGGLYSLSATFTVMAMWTNAEYLGDDGQLSLDELLAACDALPEDGEIIAGATRDSILLMLLASSHDSLVDAATGECHFDSPAFVQLLEFCNRFPAEIDWETYYQDYNYYNSYQRIRDKSLIFTEMYLYSFSDINYTVAQMGGMDGMACVGYPSLDGSTVVLTADSGLSINSNSAQQEACWAFVSQVLGDEYQDQNNWSLSVRQDRLEQQAYDATQKPYYYDENGEKVEYEQTYWDDATGEERPLNPLTQEQVDFFMNIVNSVDGSYRYDDELFTVVSEEAAAYFAGQKPAEEVARLIQSRVQIYINEQR